MKEMIITAVSSIITFVLTFLFTRRKYAAEIKKVNVETESTEIDNLDNATRMWRELSDDIKMRLTADIEELRSENKKIREELNALTRENNALRAQMASLQKELGLAKVENEKLIQQLRRLNQHLNEK